MLTITYLDAAKQEKTVTFESYQSYEQSQQACLIGIADHYKVVKVVYKGEELDYLGSYGDLYFYLLKQQLN